MNDARDRALPSAPFSPSASASAAALRSASRNSDVGELVAAEHFDVNRIRHNEPPTPAGDARRAAAGELDRLRTVPLPPELARARHRPDVAAIVAVADERG